jgi:arylformamidase
MKIVDLTLGFYGGMPGFPNPWIAKYVLEPAATHRERCRSVMNIHMCTHTATHVDAPFHFYADGRTVDEIPLERLHGQAMVIELTDKGPQQPISAKEIEDRAPGRVEDQILVLHTGWYRVWPGEGYYTTAPYLTLEAGDWLIQHKIRSLAVDLPTVDDARLVKPDKPLPVHVNILKADIPIVECLTDLDRLPAQGFVFSALPLKLKGADGSPCRAVAIVD